ncbi:RNA polymerase sigma factor [Flexithrix dorotheae]|uniref:RNA polymerase sigma factor n=1 Tax=Flexithrix dorotheae TaxID=70993 RepID=UPI00037FD6B5|nr:sigma-70 family RNA polymerase sigma factor [Flexithrix dorotheae]
MDILKQGKKYENDAHLNQNKFRHFFWGKKDAEIWNAFSEGHEGAFAYIYEQNFDILINFGLQITRDNLLLEDALQDLFIEIRKNRKKLGQVISIKAYLLKSYRRKIFRQLNKSSRIFYYESLNQECFQLAINDENAFVHSQIQEEQKRYIVKVLNELSPREKEAIYHFFYADLSYDEVAEVMGLSSAKMARNLIYKSLKRLRENSNYIPDWLLFSLLIAGKGATAFIQGIDHI